MSRPGIHLDLERLLEPPERVFQPAQPSFWAARVMLRTASSIRRRHSASFTPVRDPAASRSLTIACPESPLSTTTGTAAVAGEAAVPFFSVTGKGG